MSRHIISVLVENEAGALSRISGLFSARGYNIETLTVAPTEDASMSRMTIVTTGSEDVGHALHVLALLLAGSYFDQHEFPLDVLGLRQVDHLHHLDQLVQLLGDLLDHVLGAGRDDGHARHRRIFGRRHGERLDVVAAR